MKFTRVVPVVRTFDTGEADRFYLDDLGMAVDPFGNRLRFGELDA